MKPLTHQEIDSFLNHPAINSAWFVRRAFIQKGDPEKVIESTLKKFYMKINKVNGRKLTKEEYDKLREAIKEFSSFPL